MLAPALWLLESLELALGAWLARRGHDRGLAWPAIVAALALPRRRAAVDFFLDEVYGAHDSSERDAQFARAIHRLRAMLRLPALQALRDAVELQALTLELDVAVAERLPRPLVLPLDAASHGAAYRDADRQADRRRQIELALAIGHRLEQLMAHPTIELMLRLAAGPARLAGYAALQGFIERGYAAFRQRRAAPPPACADARASAGAAR
jgi:hypothetical protein